MSRLSRMSRVFHFSRESRRRISDIDRVHLEYIDACVKDPAMRIEYMKRSGDAHRVHETASVALIGFILL
jgi:hypothetical protein